ncbi:MAG: four helix bundle protein [Hyphomicrobiales bacterium]|nr:four helix bundle protein [Hyphomicrobiales bacterium]
MHKSYEDLKVWRKSRGLAGRIYNITRVFPKEEQFGMTTQMRRSAVSVPSNIAEGCGRNQYGEFLQFLGIASGSLAELHTQLLIASDVGLLAESELNVLEQEIVTIGKMLSGLKNSIKQSKRIPVTNNQ